MNQNPSVADSNQGHITASNPAQSIVIVCSADENYAMPMAVMLYSAMANLKNRHCKLLIYILDGGICAATKRKVVQSLISEQVEIEWIQPNQSLFTNLALTRYLTIASYYRLLMPQVVPPQFDKAIYLDCDMIVTGNLTELWQLDVGKNYVLAVQDDNQACVSLAVGLSNYRELGLDPSQRYFNSGLLVVNLAQWRADNIAPKVLDFCRQNRESIRDPDQDGLNAVLRGQWGQLDARWNQMPRIYAYASWQESPYDEATYRLLHDRPYVIHFTNAPKPWQHGCQHPATELFYHYLDQTAWTGWRDTPWRRAFRKVDKGRRKLVKLIDQALKQ